MIATPITNLKKEKTHTHTNTPIGGLEFLFSKIFIENFMNFSKKIG